jgi:PAS domain S-box-containing protein
MPDLNPKAWRISISWKVLLEVIFSLLMFGLIALASLVSTRQFTATVREETSAREGLELIERVRRHVTEMENGVRGFLLSGDEDFLALFNSGDTAFRSYLVELEEMVGRDEAQGRRLERVRSNIGRVYEYHDRAIRQRRQGGVNAAALFFSEVENASEGALIFKGLEEGLSGLERFERSRLMGLRMKLDKIGESSVSFVLVSTAFTYVALVVACVIVLRDLADRRRTQEALELERNLLDRVMEAIPDQIFVKNLRGGYLRTNAAHRRFLGLDAPRDVTGKTVHAFFDKERADRESAEDAEVLRTREPLVEKEGSDRKPDGSVLWLETTKIPLTNRRGDLVGLVGVTSDITQRHEYEDRLRHFAQALQKSNDELQSFASVASHDLQEPLRKIQAFGDRLRSRFGDRLDDQGRDFLARIMDAASRMQTLVQDLLKLSRIASRASPFERCNLAEIVRGVLRDLEVKIVSTGARVSVAGLPVIESDPTQMRQLFQNLVANALKFQKPGVTPEVLVAGRSYENLHGELPEVPTGAVVWEIRVQDNGIGFDQQFAEQIFSPFKRLHTRSEYEGTGIGLSVCRKITSRHHGTIVAQSKEGEGATFIVTLPAKQTELSLQ